MFFSTLCHFLVFSIFSDILLVNCETSIECVENKHCTSDTYCKDNLCVPICPTNYCKENAYCESSGDSTRKPVCKCNEGFIGDPPEVTCSLVKGKCENNSDCNPTLECDNNTCVDPCQRLNCGSNTECKVVDHQPKCNCLPNYIGDPDKGCREGKCVQHSDCSGTLQCDNEKCVDPCMTMKCGSNAACKVVNHHPRCTCMPNFNGDAYEGCTHEATIECTMNENCTKNNSCVNSKCENPCSLKHNRCGANTKCQVKDHIASCACKRGYRRKSDDSLECVKEPSVEHRPQFNTNPICMWLLKIPQQIPSK